MNLAPFVKQTIVSAYNKDEVLQLISEKTQVPKSETKIKNAIFNGILTQNTFRVSLATSYSQNALPLASGSVEDTSRGSIIFLHLKLFPAALLYLVFFTSIALLIGGVFILFANSLNAGIIAILVALANYLILNINFHRRAKETISAFREILSAQN